MVKTQSIIQTIQRAKLRPTFELRTSVHPCVPICGFSVMYLLCSVKTGEMGLRNNSALPATCCNCLGKRAFAKGVTASPGPCVAHAEADANPQRRMTAQLGIPIIVILNQYSFETQPHKLKKKKPFSIRLLSTKKIP